MTGAPAGAAVSVQRAFGSGRSLSQAANVATTPRTNTVFFIYVTQNEAVAGLAGHRPYLI
jgi:hypothetical protein